MGDNNTNGKSRDCFALGGGKEFQNVDPRGTPCPHL